MAHRHLSILNTGIFPSSLCRSNGAPYLRLRTLSSEWVWRTHGRRLHILEEEKSPFIVSLRSSTQSVSHRDAVEELLSVMAGLLGGLHLPRRRIGFSEPLAGLSELS